MLRVGSMPQGSNIASGERRNHAVCMPMAMAPGTSNGLREINLFRYPIEYRQLAQPSSIAVSTRVGRNRASRAGRNPELQRDFRMISSDGTTATLLAHFVRMRTSLEGH